MKLLQHILLLPFAVIYGIITNIRNRFFDWGILNQQEFEVPVISIGNLSVGGTGKTPHTELLISILKDKYKLTTLSRGYKRTTKGFVLADHTSTAKSIGDEPFQLKSKFDDIAVAVDENRCRGINKLMSSENPEVILLDDAYQHRYVKPGLSILLTDYNRLFTRDCMLPLGRLREPMQNKERADVVIVTKCPEKVQPIDFLLIKKELDLTAHQRLYFSTFEYDDIKPVFPEENPAADTSIKDFTGVVLITGIVSPQQLKEHLRKDIKNIVHLSYPDHYFFTSKDIEHITHTFDHMEAGSKAIIVTEKDAARLKGIDLPKQIKKSIYSIGIKVQILQEKEGEFKQQILGYVRKNKRDR